MPAAALYECRARCPDLRGHARGCAAAMLGAGSRHFMLWQRALSCLEAKRGYQRRNSRNFATPFFSLTCLRPSVETRGLWQKTLSSGNLMGVSTWSCLPMLHAVWWGALSRGLC